MLIARGHSGNKKLLIIGLSAMNVQKLQEGKPINMTRETHGEAINEDESIVIVFGPTELELAEFLKKSGFMAQDAKVQVDPRLKK